MGSNRGKKRSPRPSLFNPLHNFIQILHRDGVTMRQGIALVVVVVAGCCCCCCLKDLLPSISELSPQSSVIISCSVEENSAEEPIQNYESTSPPPPPPLPLP